MSAATNKAPAVTFDTVDWTSKDSIAKLMPSYLQVQYEAKKGQSKPLPKAIELEGITMKTPFGDQTLLKNATLKIEPNKKLALIGVNNCGKTLLFNYLVNGSIKGVPPHLHIHHCKEFELEEIKENVTVKDMVIKSHPYLNTMRECAKRLEALLTQVEAEISSAESKDQKGETDEKTSALHERQEALQENLDWIKFQLGTLKSDTAEERVEKMLRVLGFDEAGQAKYVNQLSGGLKMRVSLAIAFFVESDVLLLDEPTNHLDFPSVLWLENRLRAFKGSFLMVSHDRELLNNVCQTVLLMEDQMIKYYPVGFKEFEKRKAAEDQKKFDDIEKFLQKNQNADPSTMLGRDRADKKLWYDTFYAKQVALKGKFTFQKFKPLEAKEFDAEGKPVPQEKISLIKVDNVRFSYDPSKPEPVFIFNNPISITITPSSRLACMGPNGAGKSTFLKLITNRLTATSGTITQHKDLSIAYFGQHSTAELDLETTPIEFMQKKFPSESTGSLRNHLTKTSIVGNTQDTRMMRLSFSQRSCIVFAALTFQPSALLILDEPTNFLDLGSVDSLISACQKYPGALLLVSHNRDFLKKCATEYLSIVPGRFNVFGDLKSAERSTYTFIQEMEEGGSMSMGDIAKSALANNPGGGSVQSFGADSSSSSSPSVATTAASTPSSSSAPTPTAAATPAAPVVLEKFAEKEKCQAKWTDGKWYAAVIKKVLPGDKYALTYTQYGNTVTLHAASIKKASAATPAPAAAAAPKKK